MLRMIYLTHTVREKAKLLARMRRVRGQVEAIERTLHEEAGCEPVMHLIAGLRGAPQASSMAASVPMPARASAPSKAAARPARSGRRRPPSSGRGV